MKNTYLKRLIAFALFILLVCLFVSCQNAPVIPSSSVDDSSVTYNEETEKTIPDVQVADRIRASEIKKQQFAPVVADCPELARFINDDALFYRKYTPQKSVLATEDGDLKHDSFYFMCAISGENGSGFSVYPSGDEIRYDFAIVAGAMDGGYGYYLKLNNSTINFQDIKYETRYLGRFPSDDPLFDVYITSVSFKLDPKLPDIVSGDMDFYCMSELIGENKNRQEFFSITKYYDDVYVWHNKQSKLEMIEEHPEIGRAEYMKFFKKNHVNRKMTLHTDEEKGYKTVAESGWDGEIFTDTRARVYLSDGHSEIYYKIVYDWSTYLTDGYCMVESTYEDDTQLSRLEDIHPEIIDTNDLDSKFLVTRVPVSE